MDEQLDGCFELKQGKITPCTPHKKGWQDSIPRSGEYSYLDEPMPNLAAIRVKEDEKEYLNLEEVLTDTCEKDTYKVTTLESKVLNQEIHKLTALAGIAKKNIATPFSIMEQQLEDMRESLRAMNDAVRVFEKHLASLKKLAVIE